MMKMMILAGRRAQMTHDDFRRYVVDIHGPLVKSVPEVAGAIRRYHYNFPVQGARDPIFDLPLPDHLDIVTQGWFDSREAQLANMAEPRYLSIVRPDEGRFADESRALMHYTQEVLVRDGELTACKVFYFRRRRAGLTRSQFQAAWRTRFADALRASDGFDRFCSRYIQNHTMPEAEHPRGSDSRYFDVIDEVCLHAAVDTQQVPIDEATLASVRALEAELTEVALTRALVTETVVNIP
jgi:hypothetical protein